MDFQDVILIRFSLLRISYFIQEFFFQRQYTVYVIALNITIINKIIL